MRTFVCADNRIMKVRALAAVTLVACALLIRPFNARAVVPTPDPFVDARNRFALALYWQLTRDVDRFVFSPFSISSVLAMLAEGARGRTLDEIEYVAHLPRDRGARRASYAAFLPVAGTNNALFTQHDAGFKTSYIDTLRRHYRAAKTDVDFPRRIWFAKRDIDTWIANNTGKRLPHDDRREHTRVTRIEGPPDALVRDHVPDYAHFGQGMIDLGLHPSLAIYASRTRIMLMFTQTATVAEANRAIAAAGVEILGGMGTIRVFQVGVEDDGTFGPLEKALESLRADPAVEAAAINPVIGPDMLGAPRTEDAFGRLVLASASLTSIRLKAGTVHKFLGYFDILERESEDGALVLRLVRPRTGEFGEVENRLTIGELFQWSGNFSGNQGEQIAPFTVSTRSSLGRVLDRLRMETLFSESANFSAVDDSKIQLVEAIAHHASFTVTANALEAAAATTAGSPVVGVVRRVTGTAPPRPAVFLLQDTRTGMILFMGRMR